MLTIVRRELSSFVHAPIAYAVGTLFLVVQGTLFWALVQLLSDPDQPAPYGSVMSSFFGGQVLYWLILLVVVAVATMRSIADERHSGTWEMLMTAPVSDAAVVVGKWLAAALFAIALWLPTLIYPVLIAVFAPPDAHLDVAVIAASYAGVVLQLLALTAVGVAASAATRSQVVAAATVVMVAVALLLVGQLPEVASWPASGWARQAAEQLDPRAHLAMAARGALTWPSLAFHLGLVATGLAAAWALVGLDRLVRRARWERYLAAVLVTITAMAANVLAVRHPVLLDLSPQGRNHLAPATRAVLARVDEPVEVVVVRPAYDRFAPIYAEVEHLAEAMERFQPAVHVVALDPRSPSVHGRDLARDLGLSADELAQGGMVIVRAGARRDVMALLDLASVGADELGVGRVDGFYAESALAAALARVTSPDHPMVCFTGGSGERLGTAPEAWSELQRHLAWDGVRAERIGDGSSVPAECRVVAIVAPARPRAPGAIASLSRYLRGGGALLFVAGSQGVEGLSGLATLLADAGASVGSGVVVDAEQALDRAAGFVTSTGYDAEHPITRGFRDRRTTVWIAPRPVVAADPARSTILVHTSEHGQVRRPGSVSAPASVPVAISTSAPNGARVVVWGGGAGVELELGLANLELLRSSLAYLAGRETRARRADEAAPTVRLVMTGSQRRAVFVLCVLGVPLGYLLVGGALWWRRRA